LQSKFNHIGIIGCSNVAVKRFIPALIKSNNSKLEIVGSRSVKKAKKTAEIFNCKKYGDYLEVFKNPKVNTVYISLPINKREPLFKLAIKYKKNVFCEKPSFINLNDAKKYYEIFKKNNLYFFDCWTFEHHIQHQKVKDTLKQKSFGKIVSFESNFTYPKPPIGNIRLDKGLLGGVFYDSAGYPIKASLMFIKSKVDFIFCEINYDKKLDIDTNVIIVIKFKNGVVAKLMSGFNDNYFSDYKIFSSKSYLYNNRAFSIENDSKPKLILNPGKKEIKLNVTNQNQFLNMINYFSKIINLEKNKYDFQFNESLYFYKIFDAAFKSSVINKPVYFK
jgi:NDP-hexose-3-ketoreductase